MELVKLIVAINYTTVPEGLDHRTKLLRHLSGDEKAKANRPPIEENLEIRIKDKKMYINVGLSRTGAEINQPSSIETAEKEIISFFHTINNYVSWNSVSRIGVRSLWLNEYKGKFEDLLKLYKEKIFTNNKIIETAPDVGLALTFYDEKRKLGFISGPMNKKQLIESFLPKGPFETEKIPDVFSFVDCDYSLTESIEYTNTYLDKFINQGIKMGKEKAQVFTDSLGGK